MPRDVRGRMQGASVIPDRDVVGAPAVADLQIMVLRDVARQVGQHVGGLFGAELYDARGESRNH
jgi:hypothetical protein